jgi:hypothetical protein
VRTCPTFLLSVAIILGGASAAGAQDWPQPAGYAQMAYDTESHVAILYGGEDQYPTYLTDTWSYDYRTRHWQRMHPGTSPTRGEGPLDYDTRHDRVLFFNTTVGETWSYDYNTDTWQRLATAGSPSRGFWGSRMVYDSATDRSILFGGWDSQMGFSTDTWVFDYGSMTWTLMPNKVTPLGRNYHAMVYDPGQDRVLVWGGSFQWTGGSHDSIWIYDPGSNAWSKQETAGVPSWRDYMLAVYDTADGLIYLFGGHDYIGGPMLGDLWTFDLAGKEWQEVKASFPPSPRAWYAMAFDADDNVILLFGGGRAHYEWVNETWAFDVTARTWRYLSPPR